MRKTITLFEHQVRSYQKKILRLNKKAVKFGLQPMSLRLIRSEHQMITFTIKDVNGSYPVRKGCVMSICEIEGPDLKIPDYEVIGIIRKREKENLLIQLVDEELPEYLRKDATSCDHCKSNRRRNEVFVLRQEETGEFIRVGSTCLQAFTGYDAELIALWMLNARTFIDTEREELTEETLKRIKPAWLPLAYIAAAIHCIDSEGRYYSTSEGDRSTKQSAMLCYEFIIVSPHNTPVNFLELYEKANKVITWIKADTTNENYRNNLKAILENNYALESDLGYLASAYHRMTIQEKFERDTQARVDQDAKSEFVGVLGDKITFYGQLENQTFIGGMYDTVMYKFTDQSENQVIWYTSKRLNVPVGSKVLVTGKIKDHKVYCNTKQTIITRCKVDDLSTVAVIS